MERCDIPNTCSRTHSTAGNAADRLSRETSKSEGGARAVQVLRLTYSGEEGGEGGKEEERGHGVPSGVYIYGSATRGGRPVTSPSPDKPQGNRVDGRGALQRGRTVVVVVAFFHLIADEVVP